MNLARNGTAAGVAGLLIGALALTGCGTDNNGTKQATDTNVTGCAKGTISGAGSTFQANIEQEWISKYAGQCSGATVNYQGTGSGAGITSFGNGTIDFAGSDVTMKPDERTKANGRCGNTAVHIPIVAGGVALEYNISGVSTLQLSAKTIAGIFQGAIKKWNDPAVKADNPGASLPSTAITAYHRSDASGTTSVFSSFLKADAGSAWTLGTGKSLNWKSGVAAKGSNGVTAGVKQTDGAIGYAEVSYAASNKLNVAKVKGAGSSYVELTTDTVAAFMASAFSVTGTGNDLAGTVNYMATDGYPISTVTYVIACTTYKDAAKGALLKSYLNYALGSGQSLAAGLGYAPLPSALLSKAKTSASALS